jgi:hypothetical protein
LARLLWSRRLETALLGLLGLLVLGLDTEVLLVVVPLDVARHHFLADVHHRHALALPPAHLGRCSAAPAAEPHATPSLFLLVGLTLLALESLLKEAVEGCHVHQPGVLCGIISHWNTSLGSIRFLIFFLLWPRHTPG